MFQRALVSQIRQRGGASALLRAIVGYAGVTLAAGWAPRRWLERRLAELQQQLLEARIANERGGAG
jgi:hypothetical protein